MRRDWHFDTTAYGTKSYGELAAIGELKQIRSGMN